MDFRFVGARCCVLPPFLLGWLLNMCVCVVLVIQTTFLISLYARQLILYNVYCLLLTESATRALRRALSLWLIFRGLTRPGPERPRELNLDM